MLAVLALLPGWVWWDFNPSPGWFCSSKQGGSGQGGSSGGSASPWSWARAPQPLSVPGCPLRAQGTCPLGQPRASGAVVLLAH